MEDKTAGGCASLLDQLEDQAAEIGRHVSFAQPPEMDGVEFDPWAEHLDGFEQEIRLAHVGPAAQCSTREGAESDGEDAAEPAAPSEQRMQSPPPKRDASSELPDFKDDEPDAEARPEQPHSCDPIPLHPQNVASTAAADSSAKAGETADTPSDADRKSLSASAKEYWASKLDDTARAAFERKAAVAARRHEQFKKLQELSAKVKGGDEAAMVEIQRLLDGDEDFWRCYGDAGVCTESLLVNALSGGLVAVEESVRRSVASMKKALLGQTPTPLEELSVQRVIACWLFTQFMDRCCAVAVQGGSRASDLGKLQESAEKRYQTSLKTLQLVQNIVSPADRRAKQSTSPSATRAAAAERPSTAPTTGNVDPASTADAQSTGNTAAGVKQAHAAA